MGKALLYAVVAFSILWSGYAGYELIANSKTRYAPEFIFNEQDQGALLVRKVQEMQFGNFLALTSNNPFSQEIENIDKLSLGQLNYFMSKSRSILLVEKKTHWKISEINSLQKSITLANVSIEYDGVYAVLTKDVTIELNTAESSNFKNGDKKATANYWNFMDPSDIVRTDIYALNSGYFQYKSSHNSKKVGKAIADGAEFSAVLPQTIEKYEFLERFYAAEKDSVYARSPLNEWVNKGFVIAEFNNEQFLVSDYRAQQSPSLVLLDIASNADSIALDEEIKYFTGVQLTTNFPQNPQKAFYVFELEDKTVFTESLELAKKIQIAYQMGETLGLNQEKSEQLFSGLPTHTNYRKVERDLKMSITFKNDLKFAVTTVPPGEQFASTTISNWTNSELANYAGFEPIKDHIRGGYSLFAFDKEGNYVLLNNNGDVVWKGKTDTSIIDLPQVIDIFENDKHQLLFTTHKSVYLIDLNGQNVGSFPYQSDYVLTSAVSYFRWKNTTRFLVGNSKGELAMLNTSGSELNIVQASINPLVNKAYALNINGNLRGWCVDNANEKLLTFLENPTKTEKLGKSTANHFEKNGGEVVGYFESQGNVMIEKMRQTNPIVLGEGQFISINQSLAIKKNTSISLFSRNGQLMQTIDLGFNEVLSAFVIQVNTSKYTLVLDFFKNNIYCYNSSSELINGFPKEGSVLLKATYDEESESLNIYTIISNSVVCHKIKLAKNT